MHQTKPQPLYRRAARRTAKSATPPPQHLDRWTYPGFRVKVKAAKLANHSATYLQRLCEAEYPLSLKQAQRCIKVPGFAPIGKLREAQKAFMMHKAIMKAKSRPRTHKDTREDLRQLTRRVNAEEAHRTMTDMKLSPKIPSTRTIQRSFKKHRVNEMKVIVRDRIRLKNREDGTCVNRKFAKKDVRIKTKCSMKQKRK